MKNFPMPSLYGTEAGLRCQALHVRYTLPTGHYTLNSDHWTYSPSLHYLRRAFNLSAQLNWAS